MNDDTQQQKQYAIAAKTIIEAAPLSIKVTYNIVSP